MRLSSFIPCARRRGLLVLCLALVTVAAPARGRLSAQDPPAPPESGDSAPAQPTFRVEAGFVRVDAYPTKDGMAVRDLTAGEFEVLEDGVPQTIETFEHVEVRGAGPQETRREPNSVREGVAEAADPRNRVFVIFLDRYFVDVIGSHRIRRPLTSMLERIIGPDDLFAVMTPEMSAKDITLARRTTTIEAELARYWYWGKRDRLGVTDPMEAQIELCYGMRDQSAVAGEMIDRLREKQTLDALTDLAIYLRGIREERKAVIPITAGWLLYRENPGLTSSGRPPDIGGIGVGPDGRITTDTRAARSGVNLSRHECDVLRQQLAYIDNWQTYRDLLGLANRSNVSFYPVDARGLVAIDSPGGPVDQLPPHVETRLVRERVENLVTLARETDGLAVVDTNDLDRGVRRIVDDLTSYYLLGYYTSNPEPDGKYRRIEVRVTRPGVDVRHRRGYRAATAEEMEAAREMTAAAAAETPPSAVQTALDSLGGARPGLPLRTRVSYATLEGASAGAVRARLWALAELDARLAKTEEWAGGGRAEVQVVGADGTPLAQAAAELEPGARTVTAEIPGVELPGGELTIRVRLRPAGGGLPVTDTLRIEVPADPAAPGVPQLLRRGPSTGIEYLPTADQRFRRTERLRLELPTAGDLVAASAEILDRNGEVLGIPVAATMRADGAVHWAVAEVALAPLAAGDYAIRLVAEREQGRQEVVTGFRIVP